MENMELVKNFERIRSYMRQFYVYGFKSRSEYDQKSARSYDNERRRIENWLGEFMSFRREETGKQMFLSMDSLHLAHNPLYQAFKARSFTDKDITLHFYILDVLGDGEERTLTQIAGEIEDNYLSRFEDAQVLELNTLRKKLREYEGLGLVRIRKQGRELLYSLSQDTTDLAGWEDALNFFSEDSPLGVIGSFLLDRLPKTESRFRFKHHYLVHTLDSQVLCSLLDAAVRKKAVVLSIWGTDPRKEQQTTVLPRRIYISTQTGRQYLLGYESQRRQFRFFRMDTIHKVTPDSHSPDPGQLDAPEEAFTKHLWGVSVNHGGKPDHVEMIIRAEKYEPFILQRLQREKRCGTVEILDESTYRFTADVYDALEMLPWIRTFIGRIEHFSCTNPAVTARYHEDLEQMCRMYGGER